MYWNSQVAALMCSTILAVQYNII